HATAGGRGDPRVGGADLVGRTVVVGAAANKEQGDVARDRLGLDDRQPVPPCRAVDVIGGEPGLGGHLQYVRDAPVPLQLADRLPAVGRVRGGDVAIEGGGARR